MEIEVTFTAPELARLDLESRTVVVIDVVRASTTIIHGLANGCAAFIPLRSVTTARRRALELPEAVVCWGANAAQANPRLRFGELPPGVPAGTHTR